MVWQFLVFISFIQGIIFFGHFLLYKTLIKFLPLLVDYSTPLKYGLLVLSLSFLLVNFLTFRWYLPFVSPIYYAAAAWLGTLFWLFFACLLIWLLFGIKLTVFSALIVKQKSTLRRLIRSGDMITGFGYNETEPLELLLEQAEKSLFGVSQASIKEKFIHIKDVLSSTYDKITELHDPATRDKYRGVPTGFRDLDHLLTGFQPNDLVILAARPAMGKTAFALNIAQNIAKTGRSVAIISLEMSKEQLVERMFSALLGVDSWKIKSGKLSEEDFMRIGTVMDELYAMKIFIDDSVGNSISELRSKARRLQMEHGLDMIIVDYLQLMTVNGTSGSLTNRVNEISEISRSLKALARELRVPIMALSQLSRAVEMRPVKIPQLSDLRESGAIEQDADVVMMMYREDYYEEDSDRAGMADIFIRKHRSGPIGRVELAYKKEQMRFMTVEKSSSFQGDFGE
jgi:replicative DNA helicase